MFKHLFSNNMQNVVIVHNSDGDSIIIVYYILKLWYTKYIGRHMICCQVLSGRQ